VIYIQHDGAKGHPLETHTRGWGIDPSLKPADGEPVIRKRESDSFFRTTLQRELEERGITHIIIAGGMTEYCVDTTCRRAASVGYDVTLAGDAHFTRDNEVLTASKIIAHHNFVLDGFGVGDHTVRVKPADEIVF
jgi:nicotinamidase-related amidase